MGDEETTRSGLFMDQMRIIKEQRDESRKQLIAEFGENFDRTKIKPRYMVWENVCHCGTTMITTSTGYKYIKDVEVGEMVRTHDGTYHKVLQTYKTEMQPTIKVKYQGGEITCTPNHPFLTEDLTYKPIGEFNIGDRVGFKVDEPGTKSIGMATAYAFGRWLADGSVAIRNDRKTKHRIFISTGYNKYEDLKSELSKLPYRINEHKMDWAINFTFSSDEFGKLTDSAGYGARNKQVPEWVFDLVAEERDEVLRGYLAGDGYCRTKENSDCVRWAFATSSEKLAYGLARLIRAVYHVGVYLKHEKGKGTAIIAGRTVNAHDFWRCEFTPPTEYAHNLNGIAKASKYANGYVWCCIRSITEGETQDVYNLSVEDNNTYEANSVICHNCGAFSSGNPAGADFQAVLEEICKIVRHDCPPVSIPKDGWPSAGNLDGVGDDGTPFSICWRGHDAQYWGVPQRRRRLALVADFGGTSAPEILFEPYGLSWNTKQSGEARQGVAGNPTSSSGETSSRSSSDQSRGSGSGKRGIKESAKVYGICSYDSNSMKSDNPESGIYEADSARTLDLNGGNPACNQGGMAVVQGADVYNGDVTGDVAPSVTTKTGEPGSSGPKVIASPDKCLNSWDVQSKHIQTEDGIAESLYAAECRYGGGESYVLQNQETKGFNGWQSHTANMPVLDEKTPPIEATMPPNVMHAEPVLLESNQNHATIQTDGVSTTLPAAMGEGGGYVPMVCIEGNGSRDSHKGDGYSESETMYTLNTIERHAVAYGVTAKGNGDAFINSDTHTALSTGGGEPGQGYPCVLTTETTPVQSMELFHCTTEEELAAPLKARDYKDPQVVAFEPGAASRVGGHIYEDGKAGTLRAEMGDNQQAIIQSAGFCTEHSANARGIGYQEETAPTLREGVVPATIYESKAVESHAQDARYSVGEINQTLGANMEHDPANGGLVYAVDQGGGKSGCNVETDRTPTLTTTHGGEPAVCYEANRPAAFKKSSHAKTADDGQGWEDTEINDTLNAFDNSETRTPTLVLNDQGGQQMDVSEDQTATLRAEEHGHQPLVFDASRRHDYKPFGDVAETVQAQYGTGGNNTPMVFENHSQDSRFTNLGETCQTVSATWGMGGNNQPLEVKPQQAVVRRLTPTECERLQGFPDEWCHIGDWVDTNGKKHKDSDSPKYKALGNSIALPFWDWMAGRMVDQLKRSGVENPTMASLFDGISGFPYVYIRHGCTPLWSSEIEEYPIAVCKKHFGDAETGEPGDIEEYLKLPPNWVTKSVERESNINLPIAFDRAAFNQGTNAKYDFSVEQDKAQTLVSRGPGGGLPVRKEIIGSLCASDYKGIRNQDVDDGKWVIQPPTD